MQEVVGIGRARILEIDIQLRALSEQKAAAESPAIESDLESKMTQLMAERGCWEIVVQDWST